MNMDNCDSCPICNKPLIIINLNSYLLYPTNKLSNYIEKSCYNLHYLQFYIDKSTSKIDLFKLSLDDNIKVFLDFTANSTEITKYSKNPIRIKINKIIQPNFNNMAEYYDKINFYLTIA